MERVAIALAREIKPLDVVLSDIFLTGDADYQLRDGRIHCLRN